MINSLPQLAVGSHKSGSGQACIMNAISYINGDTLITDMPSCTHPLLARFAQRLNDKLCAHRQGELLCQDCSHLMWIYGARLIGTSSATAGWTVAQERDLSVKLARFAADQVSSLAAAAYAAAYAADAAYAAADAAAYAADAAAYAAAYAAADADAAADAAYAAADAAADADAAARYGLHMKLVDEFYRLTNYTTLRETFTQEEIALVKV